MSYKKIAECFVLMLTAVSIAPEFYLKPSALACKEIQNQVPVTEFFLKMSFIFKLFNIFSIFPQVMYHKAQ